MKITNEEAEYLLKLPKKVLENDTLLDSLTIDQKFPFNARFELVSEKAEAINHWHGLFLYQWINLKSRS